MSTTLFVLVVLQGANGLTFSPGYTTAAECIQQYKGPFVACFAYDPSLSTWTAFFKLPEGGFRTVGKIASEDECKRYIGAFKDGIPTACRQLAMPVTCNVACVAPVPAPHQRRNLWSLTRHRLRLTPPASLPATFRSAASITRR